MTWYTFRVAPLLPFHTSGVNTDGSTWSACCLFHVIAQLTAMLLSSDNRNPVNRCTNTACMSTVFVNECLMFVVLIIIFAAVPACMGKTMFNHDAERRDLIKNSEFLFYLFYLSFTFCTVSKSSYEPLHSPLTQQQMLLLCNVFAVILHNALSTGQHV